MNHRLINSRLLVNMSLFVFLTLAFYFAYQKNHGDTQTTRLSSLNLNEISSISIPRTPDENSLHFKKHVDDIWYMTQPYPLKAHQFRINTLLSLSQQVVTKSYTIDSLNLQDYALNPPRARIIFNTTEVAFGKTNPVNHLRYLLAEQKLVLSEDKIYPLVSAQASSFIDLSLVPDNFNLNKISTPNTEIIYDNEPEHKHGQWKSIGPTHLNPDQIQTLLQNWRSAKAFAIHKYMPRKQLGKIAIYSETKSIVFDISDDDPWLILALPELEIEFHLDKSQKNLLFGIFKKDKNDA